MIAAQVKLRKGLETAGSLIDSILAEKGLLTVCREYEAVTNWAEVAGEKIAAATECTEVTNGVLYVKVPSAAWRNELVYLKEDLLASIREKTRCTTMRDIVFY